MNPSNSFKDRVVSVATTMARAFGFEAISCASTGNLANATAAHAAKTGMHCYVFVPDDLERAKILATEAYGAKVVAVKGNYDDVNRLCSEVADALPWAFVNVNMRPYYAEGSKSLGFETAEQLGWRLPDHVVVPIASGRAAHEDPPRVPRADRDRRRRGEAVPRLRRAARGLSPGRAGVQGRRRDGHADEARHDRALARDRRTRRRLVRDAGRAPDRRRDRVVHRAGDRRGDPAARLHRGRVHRDRRRRHDREPQAAGRAGRDPPRRGDRRLRHRQRLQDDRGARGHLEPTYHVAPDLDEFLAALG